LRQTTKQEKGNTSTVVYSSLLEEMISHKKITPALATMDVDIICKLTMIGAFALVMSVSETDGEDERNAEQLSESGRCSDYVWMLLGKCVGTTHSRLPHKPPCITFADLR